MAEVATDPALAADESYIDPFPPDDLEEMDYDDLKEAYLALSRGE